MFGQINRITAVAGKRDEVIGLVMSGSDKMPGCCSYIVARDADNVDVIWVTEVWDSAASEAPAPSCSPPCRWTCLTGHHA